MRKRGRSWTELWNLCRVGSTARSHLRCSSLRRGFAERGVSVWTFRPRSPGEKNENRPPFQGRDSKGLGLKSREERLNHSHKYFSSNSIGFVSRITPVERKLATLDVRAVAACKTPAFIGVFGHCTRARTWGWFPALRPSFGGLKAARASLRSSWLAEFQRAEQAGDSKCAIWIFFAEHHQKQCRQPE